MCGVIGAVLNNPTNRELTLVKNLFLQSMIRGKHATGMSYAKDGKVVTIKEPVSADKFSGLSLIEDGSLLDVHGNLRLIGHCRYSTSDLRFNQPLGDNSLSIVHNGVITQEPPEKWETMFGHKCETANDSELVYLHYKDKYPQQLLKRWPESSISALLLTDYGMLIATRNGKRPLWTGWTPDTKSIVYASTKDILLRSGITTVEPIKAGTEWSHWYDGKEKMTRLRVIQDMKDYCEEI